MTEFINRTINALAAEIKEIKADLLANGDTMSNEEHELECMRLDNKEDQLLRLLTL